MEPFLSQHNPTRPETAPASSTILPVQWAHTQGSFSGFNTSGVWGHADGDANILECPSGPFLVPSAHGHSSNYPHGPDTSGRINAAHPTHRASIYSASESMNQSSPAHRTNLHPGTAALYGEGKGAVDGSQAVANHPVTAPLPRFNPHNSRYSARDASSPSVMDAPPALTLSGSDAPSLILHDSVLYVLAPDGVTLVRFDHHHHQQQQQQQQQQHNQPQHGGEGAVQPLQQSLIATAQSTPPWAGSPVSFGSGATPASGTTASPLSDLNADGCTTVVGGRYEIEPYNSSTLATRRVCSLDRVACFLHKKERSAQNMIYILNRETGEVVWRCKPASPCKTPRLDGSVSGFVFQAPQPEGVRGGGGGPPSHTVGAGPSTTGWPPSIASTYHSDHTDSTAHTYPISQPPASAPAMGATYPPPPSSSLSSFPILAVDVPGSHRDSTTSQRPSPHQPATHTAIGPLMRPVIPFCHSYLMMPFSNIRPADGLRIPHPLSPD